MQLQQGGQDRARRVRRLDGCESLPVARCAPHILQILRRVPGSSLWLLEPSIREPEPGQMSDVTQPDAVRRNLCLSAQSHGVQCDRLLYAPRTDKVNHIARHRAADLFVDTFVYGAHSTATDALRGVSG